MERAITPEQLFLAIMNEDKVTLKMSGLGLKLINRIITELSGKVSKLEINNNNFNPINEDALSALINLGYEKMKAYDTIKKIQDESSNLDTKDIIRMALKELLTL